MKREKMTKKRKIQNTKRGRPYLRVQETLQGPGLMENIGEEEVLPHQNIALENTGTDLVALNRLNGKKTRRVENQGIQDPDQEADRPQ